MIPGNFYISKIYPTKTYGKVKGMAADLKDIYWVYAKTKLQKVAKEIKSWPEEKSGWELCRKRKSIPG